MGNVADSKPQKYSGEAQGQPWVYGGGYMATYKQSDPNADTIQYGKTRMQIGVKMMQDVEPGPREGDLYVTDPNGKRLYFTHDNKPYPQAGLIIKHGAGYGNGPAVMITGSPLQPQYTMFYSQSADLHGPSNEWTSIQINSKADIMKALDQGPHGTGGKYANYYGDASINPFGAAEGRNAWTELNQVEHTIATVISQVALPIAESALDSFIPGASAILQLTGANKAIQGGINSMMAPPAQVPSGPFDPQISNMIKDPRLSGYLKQVQDQSQQYIAKYGEQGYQASQGLASSTPQQQIEKARQIAEENQTLYVQSQVQTMQDTITQLKKILPQGSGSDIFQNIETGLGLAQTNQQKLNVLNHFGGQIQKQLLPLVAQAPPPVASQTQSVPVVQPDLNPITASAQVGHPVLSINGTDLRHPGQTTITASGGISSPVEPPPPPDDPSLRPTAKKL